MKPRVLAAVTAVLVAGTLLGQLKTLKPGWNMFSTQQDVQLGQEAKAQVEQKMPVLHDGRVTTYLSSLGQRLARSPHAGDWPFSFAAISDKNINAFALPGGPVFINTATIVAADNEAQLAGVLAHEMSHIVLRHGTHQASKGQLIQLPAVLAGATLGNGILGQLGRLGIGLGATRFCCITPATPSLRPIIMAPRSWLTPASIRLRWRDSLRNWNRKAAKDGLLNFFPTTRPPAIA